MEPTPPKPEAVDATAAAADNRARRAQNLLLDRLKNRQQPGARERSGIPRRQEAGPVPLSFAQERLWFLDRLEPGSAAYNISGSLRLRGLLEAGVLAASLDRLAARHEALRTVFVAGDEGPMQVVDPSLRLPLPVVDLRQLPLPAAEALRLAREEARRPFDLAAGPLMRATLLRIEPEDHILLLTLHHIVTDGWSMRIYLRELTSLYDALCQGLPSPLPELPIQYTDFAAWQRDWLSGEVLAAQLAWWREKMAGAPATLELPVDNPRLPLQSRRAGHLPFRLSEEVSARLPALARERDATLFMVLLAAFQVLLQRHTGQDDIVVGTPIANRNRVELEGLIGLFANSLALRSDLSGDPLFPELLGRVRDTALGAFAHQDLPFEKLVAELRPERDLTRTPVFQVLFVLQNVRAGGLLPQAGALRVEPFGMALDTAKFDLTLSLSEGALGISGNFEYNRDLFERPTVLRLMGHFQRLLEGIAADDGQPLCALPLLAEAERQQVLAEWNDTRREYRRAVCLHELIAETMARAPEAVAVVFEGNALTYRDLDRLSSRLANRLRALGVGPEVRVAVAMARSLELIVGLVGVLRAGGAYVPLDPEYPRERLAYMLADSRAAVLLAQESVLASLPAAEVPVVRLDETFATLDGESEVPPAVDTVEDNLAYVIYTSGSTGRPKGTMNAHRGIVNRLLWMQEAYGLAADDRVLQKTPASFDVSVWEFFWPLLTGARLVVARPGGHRDPAYLSGLIRDEGITTLHFVPSMLQAFLEQLEVDDCASLRRVICSGEALPHELQQRFFAHLDCGLHNLYGPTEAAVDVTFWPCRPGEARVPIGRPIANLQIHVLSPSFQPAPIGVAGELCIGGVGVGRGYLGRPGLTAEKFVPDPFSAQPGARLYRTGDLTRTLADGRIEFLGRIDFQVKIRGFRVEIGEIEAALAASPGVRQALVLAREKATGGLGLVAYVVPDGPAEELGVPALRQRLRQILPEHMVPPAFVVLPSFPLNPSGKIDRRALPQPDQQAAGTGAPRTVLERAIAETWCAVLGLPEVGLRDNFFDLGGHSLLLFRLQRELRDRFGLNLALVDLFQHSTVAALADLLAEGERAEPEPVPLESLPAALALAAPEVAIVGMAGRFPGASSVEELWRRLCDGEELISVFSEEELAAAGVDPAVLADPRYVKARGIVEGMDRFAASFFDYSPREAQIMDPQQRLLLECAWEALEDSAIDPERFPGRIGVFAGASENFYVRHVHSHPEIVRSVGHLAVSLANRNDYLPTRISYKLDLRGPSLNIQTACSTSLVAVHLACRSLLLGECEAALAGGVSLIPGKRGYFYEEGGIASPDGHTRAFSARARGTVAGDGVGIVVLKRLADAVADGDRIYAVVRGTAVNNDGSHKVGFTAPSVDGQAAVIAAAQAAAGVDPDTIGYVEAHGTGTQLGDPIELRALTQAFRAGTPRIGSCAIGSLKTNIGHLDAAAGVAGLIKTALALDRRRIPPSLHFDEPNPNIDFAGSPFHVQTALAEWPAGDTPRRAGVSSFGMGGTNAHAILEEAPRTAPGGPSRPWQILPLSTRTPAALEEATRNLAEHLARHPEMDLAGLADAAWTLQTGRRAMSHRRVVVCRGRDEALAALAARDGRVFSQLAAETARPVFFLFPGQGSQHTGMAMELYAEEPVFREHLDRCAELLAPELERDLREMLFPVAGAAGQEETAIDQTILAQPALFAVEYALARLWMSWGVEPAGMLGHSIGEYVAACLAGVFTLEEAVRLVAARGRLMQALPAGAMLAVSLAEEETAPLLAGFPELSLAAVNAPTAVVVAGPGEAIERFQEQLEGRGVEHRRLRVSHAFHSSMVDPALEPFAEQVGKLSLQPPRMRFLSNVSGTWITPAEATDPNYWVGHLRGTVRFSDGLREILLEPEAVLLEVGPRRALTSLAKRHGDPARVRALSSLPNAGDARGEQGFLLEALGRLWAFGVRVDWTAFGAGERRRRVPLPTYPFERESFWIGPAKARPRPGELPPVPATHVEASTAASPGGGAIDAGAAPRNETERRLAAIWRDLLGLERIGIHDDFFELGGSSVSALRLASRLRQELGAELPPHALLARPTIAGLAEELARAGHGEERLEEKASSCLVPLQPRGTRVPLFLVHPAGGHVYLFRQLAEELGEDQPLYGIRARGLEAGEALLPTVEEMAAHYLEELRAFRPRGPYLLGGSSMGGMIAYEMAQRLVAEGEEVPLLALIDTFGPGQLPAEKPRIGSPLLEREAESGAEARGPLAGLPPEERARLLALVQSNMEAMYAYEPRPYPGRLVFFRADERRELDPRHPELPWIERARGGIEIYPVPGHHVSMHHRPHVEALAARLRSCARPHAERA